MSQAAHLVHTRALLGLLEGVVTPSPLKVMNGIVLPDGTKPPYVLLYFSMRTIGGEEVTQDVSLEDVSDIVLTSAYCHCVGSDQDSAQSVATRVRKALLGVTPVVAGRSCYRIRHDDGAPIARDESLPGDPVYDLVDVYSFKSIPA